MKIRLLNFAMFGESKKENFNKNEVEKLRQTSLNEVRKELKEISDNYFDELYYKCKKKSKNYATIEAYEFTLKKINELKNKGIEIKIQTVPYNRKKLEDKFPNNLWRQINFINLTERQADEVTEMAKYLNLCGIQFDAGGMGNNKDWKLDWSFCYKKTNNVDKSLEECKELIKTNKK